MNTESPSVSVIIANHNYGDYVAAAIESALNLDWPDVEVIVVDDGSTDHSLREILAFGSRITVIAQQRGGQVAACNAGFARSRGDVVIMLDADDLLAPSIMREVAAVWTGRASKVQVQMQIVDAAGKPTGNYLPQYPRVPSPQQVRAWSTRTMAYPTPPGSGNVYARWFLQRIYPFPENLRTCDASCLAAAPLLGDVITVPKPLVSYRIHGKNRAAASRLDMRQIMEEHVKALLRFRYARDVGATAGIAIADGAFNRSLNYLCYRMASFKLGGSLHILPGDSATHILRDFCAAFFAPQGVSLRGRVLYLAWAWAVALSPKAMAAKLVLWRFASGTRPSALRSLLFKLKVVGPAPLGLASRRP